jgi:YidC/Oxa1 family membrane protein insertase
LTQTVGPILEALRRRGAFRAAATFLLLALNLFLFGFVSTGCAGVFGPKVSVSANPETALAEGRQRVEKAEAAEKAGDKAEASRVYGDAVAYYAEVGRRFANSTTGLTALNEEARIQSDKLDQVQVAYQTLRNARKQYPAGTIKDADLAQRTEQQYDAIVAKLDSQNAKTPWYAVMDFLVRITGNRPVLALFIIAVLVTGLTWPFRRQLIRQSREMAKYQPEMKKIQEKYKSDPLLLNEKMREFQKEHGINMFAGCAPALLQWPITIVMYQLIVHYQFHFSGSHFLWINPATSAISAAWPAPLAGAIARSLAEPDTILLFLFCFSTFVSMKITPTTVTDPQALEQQKMMSTFFPPFYFLMMLQWGIASAFVLYWLFSNVLGIAQQFIIYRTLPPVQPLVLNPSGVSGDGDSGGSGAAAAKPLEANPKLISPKNRRKK